MSCKGDALSKWCYEFSNYGAHIYCEHLHDNGIKNYLNKGYSYISWHVIQECSKELNAKIKPAYEAAMSQWKHWTGSSGIDILKSYNIESYLEAYSIRPTIWGRLAQIAFHIQEWFNEWILGKSCRMAALDNIKDVVEAKYRIEHPEYSMNKGGSSLGSMFGYGIKPLPPSSVQEIEDEAQGLLRNMLLTYNACVSSCMHDYKQKDEQTYIKV